MFTTSNNSFGPTEISYLENKFCNLAIEANRYIVLKGSKIAPSSGADDTISSGNRKKREECKIENNILKEDVLFNSPSSAAEFVTGKSCNGWVSWKTKDGKTLHDLEEQE